MIKRLWLMLAIGVAVADTAFRAWGFLFSSDEIINLDAVLHLLSTGDYTTSMWGALPFDPAISSGLLVTWPHGVVFLLGGNLFQARLANGLLQLIAAAALAFRLARSRGLPAVDSLLSAIILWLAMVLIRDHAFRIIGPGEVWGFFYLAGGLFLVASRPLWACFFWGLSVWLCKIIYAPFAVVALAVTILSAGRGVGVGSQPKVVERFRRSAIVAFFMPLVSWMALIWLRYDLITAIRWLSSLVRFAAFHSTGLSVALPGLPGWSFSPGWPPARSLLAYSLDITLPYLIPLISGPIALLIHARLRRSGCVEASPTEVRFLSAAGWTLLPFSAWFFLVDQTQWGRHLFPALYISTAIAFYCGLDLWDQVAQRSRPATVAVIGVGVAIFTASLLQTIEYGEWVGWRGSYARTCHGFDVVSPPCLQQTAKNALVAECNEDDGCLTDNRQRLMTLARSRLGQPERGVGFTSAYMILFLQYWAYQHSAQFMHDFQPVLCAEKNPEFRTFFAAAGFDVEAILDTCPPS